MFHYKSMDNIIEMFNSENFRCLCDAYDTPILQFRDCKVDVSHPFHEIVTPPGSLRLRGLTSAEATVMFEIDDRVTAMRTQRPKPQPTPPSASPVDKYDCNCGWKADRPKQRYCPQCGREFYRNPRRWVFEDFVIVFFSVAIVGAVLGYVFYGAG